ncbi:MAG: bifunctional oligoribonuclease/PAP phosphatase NrnA [Cyclobacteriaceae bacterium]
MQNLEAFKELISLPKRIVITTHVKPDADALGSSLGLAGFLQKSGHQVTVITPTDYPEFLFWMDGNKDVLVFNEGNEEKSEYLIENADVVFCLDFSCLDRIEKLGELVRESEAQKVLIDHHLEPEDFADFVLWSTNAAATAELVYDLIEMLGETEKITIGIAEALYAGLMTDTGNFRHPSTTPKVHNIVAHLIEFGADVSKVANLIYDNYSFQRLKLMGFALSERLEVIEESNTAVFAISKADQEQFSYQTGDTEGLVNYGLSIKGINMAAFMRESGDKIKISFRSIGDFSVKKFASEYFEGGGHKNAAGGVSYDSLEDTVARFKQLLSKHSKELNDED